MQNVIGVEMKSNLFETLQEALKCLRNSTELIPISLQIEELCNLLIFSKPKLFRNNLVKRALLNDPSFFFLQLFE